MLDVGRFDLISSRSPILGRNGLRNMPCLSSCVASLFLVPSAFCMFFCFACRISGGARPRCVSVYLRLVLCFCFFPSLPFPFHSYSWGYVLFGVRTYLSCFFPPFFLSFLVSFVYFYFSLPSMYPGCWRAYVVPVVSSTVAWHCIVYSLDSITMYR